MYNFKKSESVVNRATRSECPILSFCPSHPILLRTRNKKTFFSSPFVSPQRTTGIFLITTKELSHKELTIIRSVPSLRPNMANRSIGRLQLRVAGNGAESSELLSRRGARRSRQRWNENIETDNNGGDRRMSKTNRSKCRVKRKGRRGTYQF